MNDLFVVPLTQGHFAIVDAEDAPLVSGYKWYLRSTGKQRYAVAYAGGGRSSPVTVRMHRLITEAAVGEIVDHINHYGLDNRRGNLRICTEAENRRNHSGRRAHSSSPYIGVTYRKKIKRWTAHIGVGGESLYLGCFETAKDAAIARDRAAIIHHREFASLNFPDGTSQCAQ